MKKTVITLLMMLIFVLSSYQLAKSQEPNFSIGFKEGYNSGYCYGHTAGCNVGVTPITPQPATGESWDSYKDGYNRGFIKGRDDADKKRDIEKQTFNQSSTNYTYPVPSTAPPQTPLNHPNFAYYNQMLQQASTQYEDDHRNDNVQLSEHDKQVLAMLHNPEYIKRQQTYITFVTDFFAGRKYFPTTIPNGVYEVVLIESPIEVEQAKACVKNNRVVYLERKDVFATNPDYRIYAVDINEYPDYINQKAIDVFLKPININNGQAVCHPVAYGDRKYYDNNINYQIYFLDYVNNYPDKPSYRGPLIIKK
jgi:hypothetical protein